MVRANEGLFIVLRQAILRRYPVLVTVFFFLWILLLGLLFVRRDAEAATQQKSRQGQKGSCWSVFQHLPNSGFWRREEDGDSEEPRRVS